MNQSLPTRPFVDAFPCVDAHELRRLGLFERLEAVTVITRAPDGGGHPIKVRAIWTAGDSAVRLEMSDGRPPTTVRVEVNDRAVGRIYYFICPSTGGRCLKLYYSREAWGSRKAKHLVYPSQYQARPARYIGRLRQLSASLMEIRGADREAERAAVQQRLRQFRARIEGAPRRRGRTPPTEPQDFADLVAIAAADSPPAALQPRILRELALGTELAIERGRELSFDGDDSVEWLFRRCDAFKEAARHGRRARPAALDAAPADSIWNFPRFSLRTLNSLGYLRPGARRGVRLDWTGVNDRLTRALVVIDLRDALIPYAGFELCDGGGISYQSVRLVDPCGSPVFVCPLSGAKTDVLAYREGALAAPKALRLTRA